MFNYAMNLSLRRVDFPVLGSHGYNEMGLRLVDPVCEKGRTIVLLSLQCYKRYISPCLPHACRFEPSCSLYMYEAIRKWGLMKGLYLGIRRLLRCHPFCKGGMDPVP
jgi:uncharacterized protein